MSNTDLTQITDINAALAAIDSVTSTTTYSVQLPSLSGQEVSFKAINTGQQKELLKSIVDSPFYKTKFITAFYNIIKTNYLSEDIIPLDNLTIIDKQIIALKLRIDCFNSEYDINTDIKVVNNKVDLNTLYNKSKTITIPPVSAVNIDDIIINLDIPTIKIEYNLEDQLHKNIDNVKVNDTTALRNILGEMFIAEISKYITSIQIGDKFIDFLPLMFKSRIQLLERIPNKVIQEVIKYIDTIKLINDDLMTVTLIEQDTENTITEKIEIDGSFFAIK